MLDTVLEQLATSPFVNTQPVKDLGILIVMNTLTFSYVNPTL